MLPQVHAAGARNKSTAHDMPRTRAMLQRPPATSAEAPTLAAGSKRKMAQEEEVGAAPPQPGGTQESATHAATVECHSGL